MSFENAIGVFSPDGRLYQVEYAQHASNQGNTTCLSIVDNKIYVYYENKQVNPMQILEDRITNVGNSIYLLFSGIQPDSYNIINVCADYTFAHKMDTGENVTLTEMAGKIGAYKQKYTVSFEWRPVGLKTVVFGFEEGKAKIIVIEADGNRAEYENVAIGYKSDKLYESFKNNGIYTALHALMCVSQKDEKHIKGFVVDDKEGVNEIDQEIIKEGIKNKKDE